MGESSAPLGALSGVAVLDLATFIAAPFCCTLLGEFGADVIKVEQPGAGDDLRRLGRGPSEGPSYWWLAESRNKKSITCDLRVPRGQDLIKRLVAQTDVVAENFRPGTMERWNLGYEALQSANPSLVMIRISGFGQTGPYRERPGFGRIAAAMSGASSISGYPDRPPIPPGTPTIPDYTAGLFGAFGAMLALRHMEQTGEGQVVDVALYESMLRMLDEMVPAFGATGHVRERIGPGTEYVVPHNHYRTADGRWVAIACTNDRMFQRLVEGAMGHPELVAAFPTMDDRIEARDEVDRIVQDWVGAQAASVVVPQLIAAQVPSSLVYDVADLVDDPHIRDREAITCHKGPDGLDLLMAGIVPRLTKTPGSIRDVGPVSVGAHNEEIYCGRLGLSTDDLRALERERVI